MNQKEIINFWTSEAEDALHVAEHLFEKKDYSYSLFFGHLAVEKIIKAILVKNTNQQVPLTELELKKIKEVFVWLKSSL